MSEQPQDQDKVVDITQYRLSREGTRFGLSDEEDRLDFHAYTGSPYDQDQIARTLAAAAEKKTSIEQKGPSVVAPRAEKLARLNEVRDLYKHIEETNFMKSEERAA